MKCKGLAALMILALGTAVLPARAAPAARSQTAVESPMDARSAVGVILLSGLVGGILGLSTLSFYERPEDNIRNITIGAGAGIVASAIYVTILMSTTQPDFEEKGKNASSAYVLPVAGLDRGSFSFGAAAGLRF